MIVTEINTIRRYVLGYQRLELYNVNAQRMEYYIKRKSDTKNYFVDIPEENCFYKWFSFCPRIYFLLFNENKTQGGIIYGINNWVDDKYI